MVSMTVKYVGEKHCELTHGPSGAQIATDAPKDNNGKGEAFSPTDLVGAALASCILTTIAIFAERDGLDIRGATCDVSKEMAANPRRIVNLPTIVHLPKKLTAVERAKYEQIAHTCPVHHSLHPDIKIEIQFIYDI